MAAKDEKEVKPKGKGKATQEKEAKPKATNKRAPSKKDAQIKQEAKKEKAVKKEAEPVAEETAVAETVELTPEEEEKIKLQQKVEESERKHEAIINELKEATLNANSKMLDTVVCDCGEPLKFDKEDFLQGGTVSRRFVCAKCGDVIVVTVSYQGAPDEVTPLIKTENLGPEFMVIGIDLLDKELTAKRIAYEVEALEKGGGRIDPRVFLCLKAMNFVMNGK